MNRQPILPETKSLSLLEYVAYLFSGDGVKLRLLVKSGDASRYAFLLSAAVWVFFYVAARILYQSEVTLGQFVVTALAYAIGAVLDGCFLYIPAFVHEDANNFRVWLRVTLNLNLQWLLLVAVLSLFFLPILVIARSAMYPMIFIAVFGLLGQILILIKQAHFTSQWYNAIYGTSIRRGLFYVLESLIFAVLVLFVPAVVMVLADVS